MTNTHNRDNTLIRVMVAQGIPLYIAPTILAESRATGLPLSYACANIIMESGGANVFGHDHGRNPNPIQGGEVTHTRYQLMRGYIRQGYDSNGVGPAQLTSVFLLDDADARGGAWIVSHNLHTGFRFLAGLIRQFGKWGGVRRYNGAGPAAMLYAMRFRSIASRFHRAFETALR